MVIPNAGKYVQQFALVRRRVANSVRRQQRQRQFACDFHRRLIARFFLATIMPLQLHINIFTPKQIAQLPHAFGSLRNPTAR